MSFTLYTLFNVLFFSFLIALLVAAFLFYVRRSISSFIPAMFKSLFRGRISKFAAVAVCVALALIAVGCQTPNAATYQTENLLADSATSATSAFNQYAKIQEMNGPVQSIEEARTNIYAADVRIAAALALANSIRLEMATNSASTNSVQLAPLMQAVANDSTNVVSTVKLIMSTVK